MTENETTQAEKDAAVIADFQKHIATSDYRTGEMEEIILISTTVREIVDFALAEHRTIKRLTAERDAARAEIDRLREACELVASSLESNLGYATGKPDFWSGAEGRQIVQHVLRNAIDNLRAALNESDANHD